MTRIVALSIGVLLSTPAAALAQAGPEPLGFGARAQDSPKGYFVFDARPGAQVRGRILVTNLTRQSKLVHLRTADAFTAATGGVEFTKQGGTPVRAGTWLRLDRTQVTLPPSGAVEVDFTGRVPRRARSGDHLAGIVLYGRPPRRTTAGNKNFGFRLLSRIAIAVQFTLPGPRSPALTLTETSIQVSPVGATLQLDLENSGNTLVKRTAGALTVSQGDRRLFRRRVRIGTFVPRTAIRHPLAWPGTPVEGAYRVTGVIRPQGARPIRVDSEVEFGSKKIREFREETGRRAVETGTPLWMWIVLAAALAGLGILAFLLVRRRRDEEESTRPLAPAPRAPAAAAPAPPAPAPAAGDGRVDLNSAGVEELATLPGMTRRAAERLVEHRSTNGGFASLGDLHDVQGFHAARIDRLAPHVTLQ